MIFLFIFFSIKKKIEPKNSVYSGVSYTAITPSIMDTFMCIMRLRPYPADTIMTRTKTKQQNMLWLNVLQYPSGNNINSIETFEDYSFKYFVNNMLSEDSKYDLGLEAIYLKKVNITKQDNFITFKDYVKFRVEQIKNMFKCKNIPKMFDQLEIYKTELFEYIDGELLN